MGKAEEDHDQLAAEILERDRFAGARVGQRQALAVVRAGNIGRLEAWRLVLAPGEQPCAENRRADDETQGIQPPAFERRDPGVVGFLHQR
jgi:hypothetical protein